MRKVILAVVLILFINSFSFGGLTPNLQSMNLKEFTEFVSEFTGINFVYDEKDLRGNLTIKANSSMSDKDVLKLYYTTLQVNGIVPLVKKNYIHLIRQDKSRYYSGQYKDKISKNEDDIVTTIFDSGETSPKNLLVIFKSVMSPQGVVQALDGLNIVVVRDSESRLAILSRIMNSINEKAKGLPLEVIHLQNTISKNVASKLNELFKSLQTNKISSDAPVIIDDDYSNSLILAGRKEAIDKAKYLIEKLDSKQATVQGDPKVYYLNNANAKDVEAVLNKILATKSDDKKIVKSNVTYDSSTNSIIVVGDQELYKKVEALLKKIDIPRKQVYVEALIIETTLENKNKFGVEWIAGGGSKDSVISTGFVNNTDGNLVNYQSPVLAGDSPNFAALPGGFSLGILGNIISYNGVQFPTLSALFSAIKSVNQINIMSNPQILTLDNEEAEIFIGENRPFLTTTKYDTNNNPVQSYDYRDVGVKLKVQPHISNDNMVTLDIYQEVKKVTVASMSSTAPVTLTRTTKTKVKLLSGSTMVISGIMKDDSNLNNSATPLLSRIPILGWLFKSKSREFEKTSMMVFLSANVIDTNELAQKLTDKKKIEANKFKNKSDEVLEQNDK